MYQDQTAACRYYAATVADAVPCVLQSYEHAEAAMQFVLSKTGTSFVLPREVLGVVGESLPTLLLLACRLVRGWVSRWHWHHRQSDVAREHQLACLGVFGRPDGLL